jgi:hypothetical protein
MSSVKRLLEYIDSKGIRPSKFYQETGLSNGYLDKVKDLGAEKIKSIISIYKDLNPEWLISGEGKMLKEYQTFHVISEDVSDIELYIPSDSRTEIVKLNAFDKVLLIPHVSGPLYSFLLNNLDSDNLRTSLPKYALFSTHGTSFQWSEHLYALSIFDDSLNDGEAQNYEPGDVLITYMHKELPYVVAKDKFYVVITKQKEVLVRKLELTDNLDIVKMIAANTKRYPDRTIHREDVAMVFSVQQAILIRTPRL